MRWYWIFLKSMFFSQARLSRPGEKTFFICAENCCSFCAFLSGQSWFYFWSVIWFWEKIFLLWLMPERFNSYFVLLCATCRSLFGSSFLSNCLGHLEVFLDRVSGFFCCLVSVLLFVGAESFGLRRNFSSLVGALCSFAHLHSKPNRNSFCALFSFSRT